MAELDAQLNLAAGLAWAGETVLLVTPRPPWFARFRATPAPWQRRLESWHYLSGGRVVFLSELRGPQALRGHRGRVMFSNVCAHKYGHDWRSAVARAEVGL